MRPKLFDAALHIKLPVTKELLARFRVAQQRAKRRGERHNLSDIFRDSMLAFVLHHEGIAQRPAIDPQQLDLIGGNG